MLGSVLIRKPGRCLCAMALAVLLGGACSAVNVHMAFAETGNGAGVEAGAAFAEATDDEGAGFSEASDDEGEFFAKEADDVTDDESEVLELLDGKNDVSFANNVTNELDTETTDGTTADETSSGNAAAPENLTTPEDQSESAENKKPAGEADAPALEPASSGTEKVDAVEPEKSLSTTPAANSNKVKPAVNSNTTAASTLTSQPSTAPAKQTFDMKTQAELKKRGFTYLADKKIWVYYDKNGKMLTGEHRLYDGMYYFDKKTGALKTGWTTLDDGKRTYHDTITGRALHGASAVGDKVYAFDQKRGVQSFGWMKYKGDYTYADPKTGVVKSGGQRIDGGWYWIDPDTFLLNRSGAISKLMSTAYSLLGVPYVWLGVYPDDGGMDCASFTWYVYKQLGINIGFETYYSVRDGYEVSMDSLEPGDLVFMYYSKRGPEHVVLYAGNGMIYEEPDFDGHCQYVSLESKNAWDATARRILSY